MIDSIDLHQLRNDEHLQFNKDVAELTFQNNPSALYIDAQYNALAVKNAELDALYKKQSGFEITNEIIAIDDRRDNAITGVSYVIEGFQYHFEPDVRKAAQRLGANLKLYGSGIARQNLQAETNILSSIVNDWEDKPELNEALITLGLTHWKDEIKAANDLFGKKYLERTVEMSQVTKETLVAKREETNQVYYKLRDHITAHATLTPSNAAYPKLIDQINTLIKQYNLLLEKRKKKVDDSADETPES